MKVQNMTNSSGNKVASQFIITTDGGEYFQSYESIIVFIPDPAEPNGGKIQLDADKWDYSVTTGRYRNQFLGEKKRQTQAKIDSGEYLLVDLN